MPWSRTIKDELDHESVIKLLSLENKRKLPPAPLNFIACGADENTFGATLCPLLPGLYKDLPWLATMCNFYGVLMVKMNLQNKKYRNVPVGRYAESLKLFNLI